MTKKDLIKKKVRLAVWPLMRKAWPAMKHHPAPHSNSQNTFLDLLSDWVHAEYGQYFSKEELDESSS